MTPPQGRRVKVDGCQFALLRPYAGARQRRAADGSPGRSAPGARKPWGRSAQQCRAPAGGGRSAAAVLSPPAGALFPYATPPHGWRRGLTPYARHAAGYPCKVATEHCQLSAKVTFSAGAPSPKRLWRVGDSAPSAVKDVVPRNESKRHATARPADACDNAHARPSRRHLTARAPVVACGGWH